MSAFRARYGATPLHLLAHVALLATFAWVALAVGGARGARDVVLWFVAALVVHDVVLVPLYSVLDRIARRATPTRAINHLRVPAALSALLALLFFPAICGRNDASFTRVAGAEPEGYLQRWLLVTALLFAASAVLYAVRGRRAAAATSAS